MSAIEVKEWLCHHSKSSTSTSINFQDFYPSWGARNLRKYPCTADSAELRRPAVPDDSPYQKAFDFARHY